MANSPFRAAKRVAAWALGLVAAGMVALAALAGVAIAVATPNLPEIDSLTDYRPKLPMRILSADGVVLAEFGEERRHFTPIGQIPKILRDAVLAVEDTRFYDHGGVDYKGLLRAAVAGLFKPRSQGASTITMQVARNFYLPIKKTYTRKIYEILLTHKIESQLAKDQILELYMNQIYLGQRAYGFAAASEIYFGKPLADLDIAEAAMLAGLPQSPIYANPITNPRRAALRQHHVLRRMRDAGVITAAQAAQAQDEVLRFREPHQVSVHAEYASELARQLVFRQYGEEAYTRGLDVTLTIRADAQRAAYNALRRGVLNFESRQPYRGPEAYIDLPADPRELESRVADALSEHPDDEELKAAVVMSTSASAFDAMLAGGDVITVQADTDRMHLRRGSVVRVVKDAAGAWMLTQMPEVEGAVVALDPDSGAIQALAGGFDFSRNQFDHVTQAWRQPGSSIKPFIYSAAIEKGFTGSTLVNDAPVIVSQEDAGGPDWEPKNFDGRFDGPITLRSALAKSKNMVAIRVLQSIGIPYAKAWLGRFGLDPEREPPTLSMALGAGSTTPLQLASSYAVFANGGYRLNPYLISRIADGRGRVVTEASPPVAPDDRFRVVPARNAFVMTQLLQEVTRSGSAFRARVALGRDDIYGKTGTTNDAVDAWFAGYQRHQVAVAWMGYDTPRNMGANATGAALALPMWIDYMSAALSDVPVDAPDPPEGVTWQDGEWYYDEYTPNHAVSSVGLDASSSVVTNESERRSILDLFKP